MPCDTTQDLKWTTHGPYYNRRRTMTDTGGSWGQKRDDPVSAVEGPRPLEADPTPNGSTAGHPERRDLGLRRTS